MSDFSNDKRALMKTLTRFDGNNKVEDVTGYPPQSESSPSNHTLFIHSLLEACCVFVEPNVVKRKRLFLELQKHLVHSQILNPKLTLDHFIDVRRRSARKFLKFLYQLNSKLLPSPKDSILTPQFIATTFPPLQYINKYEENFEELKVIAEGGFGTVCMAVLKVDGVTYAVKKIVFKYESDDDYVQVMREVKTISNLNHLNVVRYNNAWIQQLDASDGCTDSDESSSGSQSYESQKSFSTRMEHRKPKCAAILFPTDESSSSCSSISNAQSISEVSLEHTEETNQYHGLEKDILNGSFNNISISSLSSSTTASMHNCGTDSSYDGNYSVTELNKSGIISYNSFIQDSGTSGSDLFKNVKIKVMLCIQMEYCDFDLRHWLDQRAKGDVLPFQLEVKDIFKDISNGVAHIHSKSIIHRDLKPQNIFYSVKDNVMKIGDFGLATLGLSTPNRKKGFYGGFSSNLGTVPYAAPEQRKKRNYNSKVDIYSLGIILIELLLPFQTLMEFSKTVAQIVKGDLPKELVDQWPDYVNLVKNLVQENPKLRMSAYEILNLPIIQNIIEVDKQQMLCEIKDLRKALLNKDKEHEDALIRKDTIIKSLQLKIKEQALIIENLKIKQKG